MQTQAFNDDFLAFLAEASTPFHAVRAMVRRLEAAGFTALEEAESWNVRAGDNHYVVRNDSSLIAYAWRAIGSAPHYDDCWVCVEDPYSYSYNAFTKPEFRGQHLVPALLMYSDQEMRKSGYTHRAGIVAVSNYASLAMSKHMDSQNIGHIGFVKWFGRYRFFRSRSAAKIGIRFCQPSREKGESK